MLRLLFTGPNYLANRPLTSLLLLLTFAYTTFSASAQDKANTAALHQKQLKACAAIPVAVPDFKCDDGYIVPKAIDANDNCENPEGLYARCVFHSTLGQLEKGNSKGVQIYYSCRKELKGTETYRDKPNDPFWDIAVIQHDPKSGNTCFYQRIGDHKGSDVVPSPAKDKQAKFWNVEPAFCASCHTNGPFIRTPHYSRVLDKSNKKVSLPSGANEDDYLVYKDGYIKLLDSLPKIPDFKDEFGDPDTTKIDAAKRKQLAEYLNIKNKYVKAHNILPPIDERTPDQYKYKILHTQAAVWEVSRGRKSNGCDECHSLGAYQTKRDLNAGMTMSELNEVAAGKIESLRGRASPTIDKHHAFMSTLSLRKISKKELLESLADIDKCFKPKKDRPKDCVFRDPSK